MTKIYKTKLSSGRVSPLFPHSAYMKRRFDLFICFIAVLMLLPLFILITLAVRLTSRGPALFWSDRVGLNNLIFKMPKFRTIQTNTTEVATHLLADQRKLIYDLLTRNNYVRTFEGLSRWEDWYVHASILK